MKKKKRIFCLRDENTKSITHFMCTIDCITHLFNRRNTFSTIQTPSRNVAQRTPIRILTRRGCDVGTIVVVSSSSGIQVARKII